MWWKQRLTGFDVETTGVDIEEDRIVTAAVVEAGGGLEVETGTWLADPGVEISEQAEKVHGISNERAREEGQPAGEVIFEIVEALAARPEGSPIVAFNARFDLSMLDREARRYGITPLVDRGPVVVVDPLVIDKWLHQFRKGSRRLDAMCEHYAQVWAARNGKPAPKVLEGAHEAAADTLAALRLAYMIASAGTVVRNVRGQGDAIELNRRRELWARIRVDLDELHVHQQLWAAEQAEGLAAYFAKQGKHEDAASVKADWPVVPYRVAV